MDLVKLNKSRPRNGPCIVPVKLRSTRMVAAVACVLPDRSQFTASRIQFLSGRDNFAVFSNKQRTDKRVDMVKLKFSGNRAVDLRAEGERGCTRARSIHASPHIYVLVASVPSAQCSELDTRNKIFLESLIFKLH